MRVVVADPYAEVPAGGEAEQVTLSALLDEADFVVPLAVATAETRNLINAEALARMKRTAFLVNVSRGDLVDEMALEHALDQGVIAGAALDVGMAPFQMPSPRLAARQDVIATPHIGGLTPESLNHQAFETVAQVAAILSGAIPPGAANAGHAKRLKSPP
jgi:D-3-phosphoglycerate dehydrogenase / 2-oxoglutarate reductase